MKINAAPETEIAEKPGTQHEPLYRVLIHNDDITPMDFVVRVLVSIFLVKQAVAVEVMRNAHVLGMAYVQTLPKTEALNRIDKAHLAARLKGYPLRFSMEME